MKKKTDSLLFKFALIFLIFKTSSRSMIRKSKFRLILTSRVPTIS